VKTRATHLTLGQRLAAVREAAASPDARDSLCRRHGISPDTLAEWRNEFASAGLQEITLETFRSTGTESREEAELLSQVRRLEIMLRAKSAEASALRGLIAGRRVIRHIQRDS
jgi:transposase-like protein